MARRPGSGFDCSGLVQWSFAQAGISLPRTSGAQYAATTHIPLADIEPGDLLFYGPGGSEHVALYVGGGSMIEAPYTGAVGLGHRCAHRLTASPASAGSADQRLPDGRRDQP